METDVRARCATPPHFHECEEVIYILQGMGEIANRGQKSTFRCGLHADSSSAPRASDHEHGSGEREAGRLGFGKPGPRVSISAFARASGFRYLP